MVWELAVSTTETMEADGDLLPPEPDDEDEDDDEDEEEDDDEGEEADDDEAEAVTFASIDEASERWRSEGTAFITDLNAYVQRCYTVGPNKAGQEPNETRKDMADYVREQLVALNARGEHRRARELFPPAYEPFDYDGLGRGVTDLAFADGRIIARIGGDVYELERDRITHLPELPLFAASADRRWFAKANDRGLDIHDGWNGPRVRTLTQSFGSVEQATVAPDGSAVLLATETGIFWVSEHGAHELSGGGDSLDYPHAAMSPNGRFLAIGHKDSAHILIDRQTGERRTYDPASSYPCHASFHRDRPEAVFSSCHAMYGSSTIAVSLEAALAQRKQQARLIERRTWVRAVGSLPNGYIFAGNGGYLWAVDFAGEQLWYLFLGSSILAFDVSHDGKRMVVGSYAGYVVKLALDATAPDPALLTDAPVRELARWVFWQGHPPLIW